MKNVKSLNVLVVEGDKLNAEALRKFIKVNARIEELSLEIIHEADRFLDEIKKKAVKPHFVILSEPVHGKIKFATEVPSRINEIKKISPASKIIVLSTFNNVETVIETFRSGAYDVVLKEKHASKNVVNSINRFLNSQEEETDDKKQRELVASN